MNNANEQLEDLMNFRKDLVWLHQKVKDPMEFKKQVEFLLNRPIEL